MADSLGLEDVHNRIAALKAESSRFDADERHAAAEVLKLRALRSTLEEDIAGLGADVSASERSLAVVQADAARAEQRQRRGVFSLVLCPQRR